MSKTSKTEYKNKENDLRKGKKKYQERLIEEKLAEKMIKEETQPTQPWPYPATELLVNDLL